MNWPTPTARTTDPATSHEAARITTPKAGTHRAKALLAHAAHPDGLTDFELADLTGIKQTSIGGRRGDLCKAGWVIDSGVYRPSDTGSPAMVWLITDEGRRAVEAMKERTQ